MMRILVSLGVAAAMLDAYTTWVALGRGGSFYEANPTSAGMIAAIGIVPALALSIAGKCAAFGLAGIASRLRWPPPLRAGLLAFTGLAVTYLWLIVLSNIAVLSG